MHAQKFGCQMREDFSDINLLLVARFLTKNSRFNILLILNSKKFGECDRYFVQYLSSSLVRVDGTRSGKMANQNRLRRRNAIIFGYIKSRTVVNGKDKSKKRTRVHGLTVTNNRVKSYHILQWWQEKNWRLSYGYDFEVGKQSVESSELEETDQNSPVQVENDIDKMSNVFARVVLLVSFNISSFDYLSVKGNLEPVAKYGPQG